VPSSPTRQPSRPRGKNVRAHETGEKRGKTRREIYIQIRTQNKKKKHIFLYLLFREKYRRNRRRCAHDNEQRVSPLSFFFPFLTLVSISLSLLVTILFPSERNDSRADKSSLLEVTFGRARRQFPLSIVKLASLRRRLNVTPTKDPAAYACVLKNCVSREREASLPPLVLGATPPLVRDLVYGVCKLPVSSLSLVCVACETCDHRHDRRDFSYLREDLLIVLLRDPLLAPDALARRSCLIAGLSDHLRLSVKLIFPSPENRYCLFLFSPLRSSSVLLFIR